MAVFLCNMRFFMETRSVKNCARCKKEFIQKASNIIFCSEECNTYIEITGKEKRICDCCGKKYAPINSRHKVCSPQCREDIEKRGNFVIYDRDNFRCFYCGHSSLTYKISLHIDHVIPVSKGGKDEAGNLVTACEKCNLQKAARCLASQSLKDIKSEVSRRNEKHNLSNNQNIKISSSAEKRLQDHD